MPPTRTSVSETPRRSRRAGRQQDILEHGSESEPSERQSSPAANSGTQAAVRRITSLEEENARLLRRLMQSSPPRDSHIQEGRVIRRLVCLTDPVLDLIAEHDRRVMLAPDNSDAALELVVSSDEENCTFRSYKKLVEWCPPVRGLMQGAVGHGGYAMLSIACQELRIGADRARGDDANTLRPRVALWLNEQQPRPEPLLIPHSGEKADRGFNNDVTGRYLCPVEYNWFDLTIRHAIKNYHPHYPVTAYSWPAFLYKDGQFDAANPSTGLFKGELLVTAFKCIFTSPSSTLKDSQEGLNNNADNQLRRGLARISKSSHRPRRNVAAIARMTSVQPRAIAYIAVQLRFALSNMKHWDVIDDNFDHQLFYANITDWFELPSTPARAREVEQLLLWWNNEIFGRRRRITLQQGAVNNLSVAMSR